MLVYIPYNYTHKQKNKKLFNKNKKKKNLKMKNIDQKSKVKLIEANYVGIMLLDQDIDKKKQ